jgi:hypothetical protein
MHRNPDFGECKNSATSKLIALTLFSFFQDEPCNQEVLVGECGVKYRPVYPLYHLCLRLEIKSLRTKRKFMELKNFR